MEIVIVLAIVAGLAIYLFSKRREVEEQPSAPEVPYKMEQSVILESVTPLPVVVAGNPLVVETPAAPVTQVPVVEPAPAKPVKAKPAATPKAVPQKPAAKPAAKKPAVIKAAPATKKPRTPRAK